MISYPYLPLGRTIHYVPSSNPFMQEAEKVQKTSGDLVQPVGAVVVRDGTILGSGANQGGFKSKRLIEIHKAGFCVRKLLSVKSGEKYWLCPGCASPKNHAEPRAITDAQSRHGTILGADIYLCGHWWCCKSCWDKMIEAGIRDVYLLEESDKLFKK